MHMKCKTLIRNVFVIRPYFKHVYQFYFKHVYFRLHMYTARNKIYHIYSIIGDIPGEGHVKAETRRRNTIKRFAIVRLNAV